jgi:alkylhydroperoxidase family enzyme
MDTLMITVLRRAGWVLRAIAGRAPAPAPLPAGPGVLPAYAALARFRTGATALEPRLQLLVTQLAAERSHCRWCIERGRHLWREAVLPAEVLRALRQYAASPLFSNRERAALTFADAVTRYSDATGGMPMEPLASARAHFSEAEVAALTEAVAAMHFFNPITGALGADVQPRVPSPPRHPAGLPSSIRNFWL